MGCQQSTLVHSPRDRRQVGGWEREQRSGRELTLVEKWIEFREWVRRPRKTKVVPISIQRSQSYTRVTVTGEVRCKNGNTIECVSTEKKTEQEDTSPVDVSSKQEDDSGPQTVAVHRRQSKMIRPKAAKGERTSASVLGSTRQSAGVLTVQDMEDSSENLNVSSQVPLKPAASLPDQERKVSIQKIQSTFHLPGSVQDEEEESVVSFVKHQTVIDNSSSSAMKIRPKAAKGKRSAPAVNTASVEESSSTSCSTSEKKTRPKAAKGLRKTSVEQTSSVSTPDDCLNTWMKRRLSDESQGRRK